MANVFEWHRGLRGEVSTTALALALVLSSRMDHDGSIPARFSPGIERLSRDMGYAKNSRRGAINAMKELEQAGFLQVDRPGPKQRNRYQATLPLTGGVAQTPQGLVASQHSSGGQSATLPTQPSPTPTPSLDDARAAASEVLCELAASLPSAEADMLVRDVRELRQREQLRDAIAELVAAGHRQDLLAELRAVRFEGSSSPYAGAAHPGRLVWMRTSALRERLLRTAGRELEGSHSRPERQSAASSASMALR